MQKAKVEVVGKLMDMIKKGKELEECDKKNKCLNKKWLKFIETKMAENKKIFSGMKKTDSEKVTKTNIEMIKANNKAVEDARDEYMNTEAYATQLKCQLKTCLNETDSSLSAMIAFLTSLKPLIAKELKGKEGKAATAKLNELLKKLKELKKDAGKITTNDFRFIQKEMKELIKMID